LKKEEEEDQDQIMNSILEESKCKNKKGMKLN
jgi:hypothetical protein